MNRSRTPWIMVASHFPLFHSVTHAHANMSAAHYVGDEKMGDYALDGAKMRFTPCAATHSAASASSGAPPRCQTVGEFQAALGAALQARRCSARFFPGVRPRAVLGRQCPRARSAISEAFAGFGTDFSIPYL